MDSVQRCSLEGCYSAVVSGYFNNKQSHLSGVETEKTFSIKYNPISQQSAPCSRALLFFGCASSILEIKKAFSGGKNGK